MNPRIACAGVPKRPHGLSSPTLSDGLINSYLLVALFHKSSPLPKAPAFNAFTLFTIPEEEERTGHNEIWNNLRAKPGS